MAAELRIPEVEETLVEEHGVRILKENKGAFLAKAWRGRAKKPYAYYRFPTEERRDAWVVGELEAARINVEAKAIKAGTDKLKKAAEREKYLVGTVLCNSWGYDQTNIDYYEVVRRSATGATVWVKEIGCESVPGSEGFMCDAVVPKPGLFLKNAEEIKKVVGTYGVQFRHGWTSIVEDIAKKEYRSWYA